MIEKNQSRDRAERRKREFLERRRVMNLKKNKKINNRIPKRRESDHLRKILTEDNEHECD